VGQVGPEHGRTCGARGEVDLEIHATLVRVARSAPPPSPVARLELGPPPYDLGTVLQHEPVRRAFPVRSAGTLPLEIRAVDRSRFSSATVVPPVMAPGAAGWLEVECRSDLYGPLREPIDIHSNDARSPTTTIELRGTVTPLLAFDTATVDLRMRFGPRNQSQAVLQPHQDQRRARRLQSDQPAIPGVLLVVVILTSCSRHSDLF
jgi:hypothetical protein